MTLDRNICSECGEKNFRDEDYIHFNGVCKECYENSLNRNTTDEKLNFIQKNVPKSIGNIRAYFSEYNSARTLPFVSVFSGIVLGSVIGYLVALIIVGGILDGIFDVNRHYRNIVALIIIFCFIVYLCIFMSKYKEYYIGNEGVAIIRKMWFFQDKTRVRYYANQTHKKYFYNILNLKLKDHEISEIIEQYYKNREIKNL